jgi:hypothetical protein
MSLGEEEFGALALETAEEEVGAELQEVGGLVLEDFAVESADFVGIVAWESHDRPGWMYWCRCGDAVLLCEGRQQRALAST